VEPKRDYYEVLGVARDADQKAIKDAFRELALKYHPDRNKEPGAEERFKEVAEAYAILSDPNKRSEYDMRGHAGVAGFSRDDLFGGINFEDLFGDTGIGFGGGLFDRFFGRRAGPRRGRDTEVVVRVSLDRIVNGGEEPVLLKHARTCTACNGTGAKDGTAWHACAACDGTGQNMQQKTEGGVFLRQISTCPDCGGRGQLIDEPCSNCTGSGQTADEEILTVQIPVGAEEGMALRVTGHGAASAEPGVPPGDLFVMVRTRPDPRFERRGADLWRTERIKLTDAVLGTELRLPSLEGSIDVQIPPGAQPDSILRLQAKGLPVFGGGSRGDYFIRIEVHVPESLSPEERSLYDRLRDLARRKE
jgi:molecular chaperone DnaJ